MGLLRGGYTDTGRIYPSGFLWRKLPEQGYANNRDYNACLYGSLFKEDFIGRLPRPEVDEEVDDSWEISSVQIRRWFDSLEEEGITKEALQ